MDVNYFEVLYKNWHGDKKVTIVATPNDNPKIATISFDFNWNGNKLIDYKETSQENYKFNIYKFFKQ